MNRQTVNNFCAPSFENHCEISDASGEGWRFRDHKLFLGDTPVQSIFDQVGQPVFLYSKSVIAEQIAKVRSILPQGAHLHYAVKANPNSDVLAHIRPLVDGADIASEGELMKVLTAGFNPQNIGFAGPGKSAEEIATAVKYGVTVTAESMQQIRLIAQTGHPSRKLAIRINPNYELRGSGMRMAGGASAFGIDEEQMPQAIALAHSLGLSVTGLHLYAGSQNLDASAIAAAADQAIRVCCALSESYLKSSQQVLPLEWVNIGGGFGVPYFPGEKQLNLEPIQEALHRAALSLVQINATLRLELGRFLVADAGTYVCQIIDQKVSRGHSYLILDGGLHHHQAACGNFGQVIKRPYPIALSKQPRHFEAAANTSPQAKDSATYQLVGPLCTPMDTLAKNLSLENPEIGDLIAVFRSGAYGPSASPQAFLGHKSAVEILL